MRVAVEDPGYAGLLDLLDALGLGVEPVAVDDSGPVPDALAAALRRGARAAIFTPRAQNPMGSAITVGRAGELAEIVSRQPDLLVVEDDHAGPVAGAPAVSVIAAGAASAHAIAVRSSSKALGPDLRVALVAGDAETVAAVEARQAVGAGWVSHILQELVLVLLSDPATSALMDRAALAYAARRGALLDALARLGVAAHGRSGPERVDPGRGRSLRRWRGWPPGAGGSLPAPATGSPVRPASESPWQRSIPPRPAPWPPTCWPAWAWPPIPGTGRDLPERAGTEIARTGRTEILGTGRDRLADGYRSAILSGPNHTVLLPPW